MRVFATEIDENAASGKLKDEKTKLFTITALPPVVATYKATVTDDDGA